MTYFVQWGSPEFEEAVQLAIQEAYVGVEWSSEELNLPVEYETIHLDIVEDISDIDVADARKMPDGRFLITVEASLDCNFDVFIFKPDYPLVEDDPRLFIFDPSWNKHYMRAEIALQFQSSITLVLDTSDAEQRKIEVLYITPKIPDDERLELGRRHRYRR